LKQIDPILSVESFLVCRPNVIRYSRRTGRHYTRQYDCRLRTINHRHGARYNANFNV